MGVPNGGSEWVYSKAFHGAGQVSRIGSGRGAPIRPVMLERDPTRPVVSKHLPTRPDLNREDFQSVFDPTRGVGYGP